MSQRNVGIAVASVFLFFLLFLEFTISKQPDTQVPPGEVGGVQTAESLGPAPSPTATVPPPTHSSTPTQTPSPRKTVKVTRVVDGDTIQIDSGETVRYIGMDTPESVDPRKGVQCFAKEATEKNTALVLGKTVELEHDISKTDRYGRLLAYVWLNDLMVNEYLVRQGYAFARTFPPDVKYQLPLLKAEAAAQQEKKGLWGDVCISPPV